MNEQEIFQAALERDNRKRDDFLDEACGDVTGLAPKLIRDSAQEMARIPHGANAVTSVALSLDSAQLLTVSRKVVRIWDIATIPKIPKKELMTSLQ